MSSHHEDYEPVIVFLAGKIHYDGKIAKPDKRLGKLILSSNNEGIVRIQWINLDTENGLPSVIDDWIVMKDAYLERVCAPVNGRIYCLRFINRISESQLFWMQSANDPDEEMKVKKFNEFIGMNAPKDLGTPATVEDRNNIVTELSRLSREEVTRPIPLSAVLSKRNIMRLVDDERACKELIKYLPELHTTKEDLKEVISSPQLASSLSLLNKGVQDLLYHIGVRPNDPECQRCNDPLLLLITKIQSMESNQDNCQQPSKKNNEENS